MKHGVRGNEDAAGPRTWPRPASRAKVLAMDRFAMPKALRAALPRAALSRGLAGGLARRLAAALACSAALAVLSATRNAAAFGGTADRLGQQGNFVISNRANLGFDQGLSYKGTSLSLAPELDYFVVRNLSLGGAVLFNWDSNNGTSAGVVPQIAFHVPISETWSFWPRLALTIASGYSGLPGDPAHFSVEASAPFLIHPAEHFFFGFGPAFATDLAGANKITHIYGTFLVGGYFDS